MPEKWTFLIKNISESCSFLSWGKKVDGLCILLHSLVLLVLWSSTTMQGFHTFLCTGSSFRNNLSMKSIVPQETASSKFHVFSSVRSSCLNASESFRGSWITRYTQLSVWFRIRWFGSDLHVLVLGQTFPAVQTLFILSFLILTNPG